MKKKLLLVFIVLLLQTGCSYTFSINSTEDFIESVPHPKSTEILDKLQKEDYEVVFYEDETGFRIGYKKSVDEYWTHTGNGEIDPGDGMDWVMFNNPKVPLTLVGGIITNDQITTVLVKQKTIEKGATIVEISEGLRCWFVTFDALEEADAGEPDPLKIEAFDSNGNVLWKEGVYEGGHFSGKITN
ncbi:hypothetical protein [uncultured Psychrobacillus sp.]|uniref:hypothetical protein n=1 Tax=uncultured Psychrobacillus sp. TaxID=1551585 RepID=UPI0026331AE6|nr:hypothetical protein [uncultured Psychrobacillus sp.]